LLQKGRSNVVKMVIMPLFYRCSAAVIRCFLPLFSFQNTCVFKGLDKTEAIFHRSTGHRLLARGAINLDRAWFAQQPRAGA